MYPYRHLYSVHAILLLVTLGAHVQESYLVCVVVSCTLLGILRQQATGLLVVQPHGSQSLFCNFPYTSVRSIGRKCTSFTRITACHYHKSYSTSESSLL